MSVMTWKQPRKDPDRPVGLDPKKKRAGLFGLFCSSDNFKLPAPYLFPPRASARNTLNRLDTTPPVTCIHPVLTGGTHSALPPPQFRYELSVWSSIRSMVGH